MCPRVFSAINSSANRMRTVGFVICAHSRINIRSERAKLARCHSYQPVIKWVIITDLCCHIHCRSITIITCLTYTIKRHQCPRFPLSTIHWLIHNTCNQDFERKSRCTKRAHSFQLSFIRKCFLSILSSRSS